MSKVLITSALPYVNNVPHLGNIIGSTLSADVYARFRRFMGDDVLYLCGTDNYGTTTEIKAKQLSITCQEVCDQFNKLHKDVYDWFNIKFDVWGSTSNDSQTKLTHQIFLSLYQNGFIEEKSSNQYYCDTCNMFLPDRFIKGICPNVACKDKKSITNGDQCDICQNLVDVDKIIDPFCVGCKNTPVLKETQHLYLKLNDLAGYIEKYAVGNSDVNFPLGIQSIAKSWIEKGLESRCITRDLHWGTPVPWEYDETLKKYKGKVFYVWFDAPIGYYSILMNDHKYGKDWKDWLNAKNEWVLMCGIDNVPFHTVMFPGSILGSDVMLPLPTKIYSTQYLLYEKNKFSKSNNVGIFGNQAQLISEKLNIHEDYWRFHLIKLRPELHEVSFDWNDFLNTIKGDMVHNIGNFINRCISMTSKYCIDGVNYEVDINNNELQLELSNFINSYVDAIENFSLKNALSICLKIGNYGNGFVELSKLWRYYDENYPELYNMPDKSIIVKKILGNCAMIAIVLSALLLPIIPKTSHMLLEVFGINSNEFDMNNLKNIISISSTIKIDLVNYHLPFKIMDKKNVISVLKDLNINFSL